MTIQHLYREFIKAMNKENFEQAEGVLIMLHQWHEEIGDSHSAGTITQFTEWYATAKAKAEQSAYDLFISNAEKFLELGDVRSAQQVLLAMEEPLRKNGFESEGQKARFEQLVYACDKQLQHT